MSLDSSSELAWLTIGYAGILGVIVAAACPATGVTVFLGVMTRLTCR